MAAALHRRRANSTFAIRGFVQDSGTAPTVATYFADVVAPRGNGNGIPVGETGEVGTPRMYGLRLHYRFGRSKSGS